MNGVVVEVVQEFEAVVAHHVGFLGHCRGDCSARAEHGRRLPKTSNLCWHIVAVALHNVRFGSKRWGNELTAELPGMDEKNLEVKVADGNLIIKGEKQEEKEEKKKDYYMRERSFGSFERRFELPEGVDADKIEASFKKGVLTLTLPKKPEAQKPAKKIEVKAA